MLPDVFFCYFIPVHQQTTSEIGHRVKYFFRVGNQYAECEKQQHQQHSKSMDQPGKVAKPARGQLNRENEYFSVRVRA